MNDLAQFQPAFNGVNTLLAVPTNIETGHIIGGTLNLKEAAPLILFHLHLVSSQSDQVSSQSDH
jgi:hypothetical protein